MSQSQLIKPQQTHLIQNKSIHLPHDQYHKQKILKHIDQYLKELQHQQGNTDKMELLKLRKKLITKQGLSMQRIDNLQNIFLHYCSHIFKTGKHMTFERLQYQKSHLTMDRFFVFLKDFNLITAIIDGVSRQIFDKAELVLIFKKVSANCKDLNFQQFITCLQRIGSLYYDYKVNYNEKQQKIALDRKKRKDKIMKSLARRKAALEAAHRKINGEEEDNDQKLTSQQDNNQNLQENNVEQQNQNDNLVNEMINDKNIEDPQVQLRAQQQQKEQVVEGQIDQPVQKEIQNQEAQQQSIISQFNREELLQLSCQQKIQYFYQVINVDNAASFKKKMRQLNLPLFQNKHKRTVSHNVTHQHDHARDRKISQAALQDQKRIQELKTIIEERKERDRQMSPHVPKEDYQDRRKKRKIQEQHVLAKRLPRRKKIQVTQLETDLSSLSKLQYDKINFKKFNPHKLYQASQEDDPYLQEYTSSRRPPKSQKRIPIGLENSDKTSQLLLDKLKKRTQQIQTRQKIQEQKYSMGQDLGSSPEHQLRKNRLVQKLLKMHKG